jgi:hypothetical protein
MVQPCLWVSVPYHQYTPNYWANRRNEMKTLPKIGQIVETPYGEGVVLEVGASHFVARQYDVWDKVFRINDSDWSIKSCTTH